MKTFSEYLHEDFKQILREPSSLASKEAKALGLTHYGFGKYGDDKGKISHVVVGVRLKKINPTPEKAAPAFMKHFQKLAKHSQGLSSDKDLSKMKTDDPETYTVKTKQAADRIKKSEERAKEDEAVYKQIDKAPQDFEKVMKEKDKEAEDHHKKLERKYDWRGMTPDEKKALLHHTTGGNKDLDGLLANPDKRSLKKKMPNGSTARDTVKHLTSLMDKTSAPHDFPVYASFSGITKKSDDLTKNQEYTTNGFKKTTLHFKNVLNGKSKRKNVIQFNVKKGHKGFYMDGNEADHDKIGERHFILPHGTKVKLKEHPQTMHVDDDNIIKLYDADLNQDKS